MSTEKFSARPGRKHLLEGSLVMGGQALSVIGALLIVRLLNELLTPAEYGMVALGLTMSVFTIHVFLSGLNSALTRMYSIAATKSEIALMLDGAAKLFLRLGVVAGSAFLAVFIFCAATGAKDWLWILPAAFLYALLSGLNLSIAGVQNAARDRSIVAGHAGGEAALRILLCFVFVATFSGKGWIVLSAYAVAALILVFLNLRYLRRKFGPFLNATNGTDASKVWIQELWKHSWPFSAWGLFTWAQLASDRWALQITNGPSSVGQYAVLYQLGFVPTTVLVGAIITLVIPVLYQRFSSAGDIAARTKLRTAGWIIVATYLGLTIIGAAVVHLSRDLIYALMTTPPFRGTSQFLWIMVLAGGLWGGGQFFLYLLQMELRTSHAMAPKVGASILGVIFSYFGAVRGGIMGVAYAQLAYGVVYVAWAALAYWAALRGGRSEIE